MMSDLWFLITTAPKDREIDIWVSGPGARRVADCRWGVPSKANWGDRYGDDKDLPPQWMTREGFALDRRNGEATHWSEVSSGPSAARPAEPAGEDELYQIARDIVEIAREADGEGDFLRSEDEAVESVFTRICALPSGQASSDAADGVRTGMLRAAENVEATAAKTNNQRPDTGAGDTGGSAPAPQQVCECASPDTSGRLGFCARCQRMLRHGPRQWSLLATPVPQHADPTDEVDHG